MKSCHSFVCRLVAVTLLTSVSFSASAVIVTPNWSSYTVFMDEYAYVGGDNFAYADTSSPAGLPLTKGLDVAKNWTTNSWSTVTTGSSISYNSLNGMYSTRLAPVSVSQNATGAGQFGYGQSNVNFLASFTAGSNDALLRIDYSLLGAFQVTGNNPSTYSQLDTVFTVNGQPIHWLNNDDYLYVDRDNGNGIITEGQSGFIELSLNANQLYNIEVDLLGYLSSGGTSSASMFADATFGFRILPISMPVPEPGAAPMLALGLMVMAGVLRRRRPM